MPTAALTVPTAALTQLGNALREAERTFGSAEPLLKRMGVTILKEIDENFRQGGRPPWAPLAASTQAVRRGGKGGQILVDTGRLRRSFDVTTGRDTLTVFSRDPVAVYAEFGTRPHEIRAKPGKTLAIPTGPRSLKGLGRARATGRGSFRTPSGRVRVPFRDVIFRQKVHHPGTPPRPILPTAAQILPKLLQIADQYVVEKFLRSFA